MLRNKRSVEKKLDVMEKNLTRVHGEYENAIIAYQQARRKVASTIKEGKVFAMAVAYYRNKQQEGALGKNQLKELNRLRASIDSQIDEAKKNIKSGAIQKDLGNIFEIKHKKLSSVKVEDLDKTLADDMRELHIPDGEAPGEKEIIKALKGWIINDGNEGGHDRDGDVQINQ